jgi:hypothetical protein
MLLRLLLAVSFTLLGAVAAPAAEVETFLAKPGKLAFADDFQRAEVGDAWKTSRNEYSIQDGVFITGQRPEHGHPAVSRVSVPLRDAVVTFRFKFNGARGLTLVLNDSEWKQSHAGHICRAGVTLSQVTLGDDKEGRMKFGIYEKWKDPATKAEVERQVKDRSRSFPHALEAGKWYAMTVEFVADEMLASIDGRPIAYLKSPGFAHPTKNYWGFTTSGQYVEIDDLKAWHADPDPTWPDRRAKLFPAGR